MLITRRQLLKSAPAVLLVPGLLGRQFAFPRLASAATSGRTLVIVQQAGGNDGLNTIVPFTDGRYYDLRPNIAIPQKEVIPVNNEAGFHPSMFRLKTLWDAGKVAIVEGVGYANPSFSHFQAMDVWRFADTEVNQATYDYRRPVRQGWLGRYLETVGASNNSLQGFAVGRILPREMYAPRATVAMVESVQLYQFQGDSRYSASTQARTEALVRMYDSAKATVYGGLLNDTVQAAQRSSAALQQADKAYRIALDYPDTPLAKGLRTLAAAIVGELGVKVGHVTIGGWDTHASQKPDHARLLQTLCDAIYTFYEDLKAHGKDRDVVIMTWSEFGRRAKSNASEGTDHGWAMPIFFIGTPVKGGFYGQRPDLGALSKDNLRFTTDFRTVYATVLEKWLEAPSNAILGKQYETLPLFNT